LREDLSLKIPAETDLTTLAPKITAQVPKILFEANRISTLFVYVFKKRSKKVFKNTSEKFI